MKNVTMQPPPGYEEKTANIALPVSFAILGASVVLMAVMLLSGDKTNNKENGNYDVENYDVVGNQPFIYGIAE